MNTIQVNDIQKFALEQVHDSINVDLMCMKSELKSEDYMTNDTFSDGRKKRHIYVDSKLDDLPLTMEAFRVYCHLCRRAGCDNNAFPSYKSIGEACFRGSFPNSSSDTLRRKAIAAVDELVSWNLITKTTKKKLDGSLSSNQYRLTDIDDWRNEPTRQSSLTRGQQKVNLNEKLEVVLEEHHPSDGGTPLVVLGEHHPSDGGTLPVVLEEHHPSVGGTPKVYPIEDYPIEVYPDKEEPRSSGANSCSPPSQQFSVDLSNLQNFVSLLNLEESSTQNDNEVLHEKIGQACCDSRLDPTMNQKVLKPARFLGDECDNLSSGSKIPSRLFDNPELPNLENLPTQEFSLSNTDAVKLEKYQQLDASGIKLKQPELRDWARLSMGSIVKTYRKSGFILTGGNDVSTEFAIYVAKQNCRKGQDPTIALGFNVINKCEGDPRCWQKLVIWVTEWQQLRQTGQQTNVAANINQQQQLERIRQAASTKFEL